MVKSVPPMTLKELNNRVDDLSEDYEDDSLSPRDVLARAIDLLFEFQTWAANTGLKE